MNKLIRPILFTFFVILTTNVFSIERDSLRVKKERIFEVFETFGLNSTYSDISPVFFNTELVCFVLTENGIKTHMECLIGVRQIITIFLGHL